MSKAIQIKKGLNIPLAGSPSGRVTVDQKTDLFAITPDDFPGYTWKAAVKAGDEVCAGTPLLFAKEDENICLVSPVSGTVKEINRGERRKIMFVSVTSDKKDTPVQLKDANDTIVNLKRAGLFAMLRQRPFDIVPMDAKPRDIFVTAFDTAPLAPALVNDEVKKYLEVGLKTLSTLTDGKVYLSVAAGSGITSDIAEVFEFNTLHPAGNTGTQIAAIRPVNKGEVVWTLDAVTAAKIGQFITEKKLSFNTTVAITGPDAKDPHLVDTLIGASLESLLQGEIKETDKKVRIISGNVLTGFKADKAGFLRFPYRQITLIDEGDEADEFMGWASMNPSKYSVKRSFPAFLRGLTKPFNFDARVKGGHRAMILSGELDRVFPFDIYPEYLLKAIMAKDIEKMEQLGIYEVAPEDFALPEFVDTSKNELQKTVREGLDYLRKETL